MMACSFPLPILKERAGQSQEPGSSVMVGLESVVERLLLQGPQE